MNAIMSECVGPRCLRVGMRNRMRMSMSGITDSVRTTGMLSFVFCSFAEVLLEIYPNARWPTANDLFSSCCSQRDWNDLIRFIVMVECRAVAGSSCWRNGCRHFVCVIQDFKGAV